MTAIAQSKGQTMQMDAADEDEVLISTTAASSQSMRPNADAEERDDQAAASSLQFPALSTHATPSGSSKVLQSRKVPIPPHRMAPLKKDWLQIYEPLVQECMLQIRMNTQKRCVELRTSKHTPEPQPTILQKAVDFVAAYALGFEAKDAIALVRMDDLYIETFEIKDVKMLHGDHLARAIGRIAGKDGKTRFTIENASRTRIVLADSKISILGTFGNIKMARDAICALILGSVSVLSLCFA